MQNELSLSDNRIEIQASVELQEPIAGVDYSKNGFMLSAKKVVFANEQIAEQEVLDNLVTIAVHKYYERLKKEVQTTRNDLIDQLRVELDQKYAEKLESAKKMILEQREEIKLLKGK